MTWTIIAHRSELSKPGDFVNVGGIAAVNHDGNIVAWDGICAHRGARVFDETHGNRPLVCPYHGFKGDAVIGDRYLTAWVGDWFCVGDGSVSLAEQFGGVMGILDGASSAIRRRFSFDSFAMSCHWSTAVENTLEDLHVPSVHPDTFHKLDLRLIGMDQQGKNSVAFYNVGDAHTVRGLTAMSRYFDGARPGEYFHLYLWPHTCLSSVGGFSYSLQHYFPSAAWTQFHTRLYVGPVRGDAPNLDYFFEEAAGFNRKVFQQDAAICARVVGKGTRRTESEKRVQWFRNVSAA